MELLYTALSTGVQLSTVSVTTTPGLPKSSQPLSFVTRFSPTDPDSSQAPAEFTALHQFRRRFALFRRHITTSVTDYLLSQKKQQETVEAQTNKQYRLWTHRNVYLDDEEEIPEWVAKANSLLGMEITTVDAAYDRAEDLFPAARFIVDPTRFQRQAMQPPLLKTNVKWPDRLQMVTDVVYQYELHKRNTIWRFEDIRTFLRMYFKFPKKFKDIRQHLPHKTPGDLIQLYYLLKMPFRLKKRIRRQAIQFRRNKSNLEQLIETHIDKILTKVQEISRTIPSVKRQMELGLPCSYLSMEELAAVTEVMCREDRETAPRTADVAVRTTSVEYYCEMQDLTQVEIEVKQTDYRKRYGKGSSDYKEYARYKEYAYGGEKIQDEGPGEQEKQWTYAQKKQFLKQFKVVGKNWDELAQCVDGKTPSQVKAFYDTYRKKLNLDALEPRGASSA